MEDYSGQREWTMVFSLISLNHAGHLSGWTQIQSVRTVLKDEVREVASILNRMGND